MQSHGTRRQGVKELEVAPAASCQYAFVEKPSSRLGCRRALLNCPIFSVRSSAFSFSRLICVLSLYVLFYIVNSPAYATVRDETGFPWSNRGSGAEYPYSRVHRFLSNSANFAPHERIRVHPERAPRPPASRVRDNASEVSFIESESVLDSDLNHPAKARGNEDGNLIRPHGPQAVRLRQAQSIATKQFDKSVQLKVPSLLGSLFSKKSDAVVDEVYPRLNAQSFESNGRTESENRLVPRILQRKRWIAGIIESLPGNQKGQAAGSTAPEPWNHPVRGDYHGILWKYQFVWIVSMMVGMFVLQLAIDMVARKRFLLITRVSTCLMLGANFRGIGETKRAIVARFLTCAFLHIHAIHLVSNVFSILFAWLTLAMVERFPFNESVPIEKIYWCYHWTFPVFVITAFCGSWVSYCTSLRKAGFSIGASGGCLGLAAYFLAASIFFGGFSKYRLAWIICSGLTILLSCFPVEYWCGAAGDTPDLGAHLMGSLTGFLLAVALYFPSRFVDSEVLMWVGDVLSCIFIVAVVLAYVEIIRVYIVDGRHLLTRMFIKWMEAEKTTENEEQRRHTTPGRVDTRVLTSELAKLLDDKLLTNDIGVVIEHLNEEMRTGRKSLPDLGDCAY